MSEVISDPTDVEEPGLNLVFTATQPHLVITVLHQGVLSSGDDFLTVWPWPVEQITSVS